MADPTSKDLSIRTFYKIAALTAVVAILILVSSSAAVAQPVSARHDIDSAGLMVEATIGWGGNVDRSSPIPISFMFRNDSPRNIEGVLHLTEQWNGQEVSLGEIVIAPGTSRRVTSIQSLTNWSDCIAKFSHNGKILWRRELGLSSSVNFNGSVNILLFVDNSGRRLQLPGALFNTNVNTNRDFQVAEPNGRPVECLTVKPWQISNHPGPLITAEAMVFPDGASERDLNRVQWQAVADWMCQGGAVFAHSGSRELIDRLVEVAPLATEIAEQSGIFTVRRFGLGAIYEYPQPLLSSDGSEVRQKIAETTAVLKRNPINTFIDSGPISADQVSRAERNWMIVLAFFCLYMFLTGFVALLLHRLSQRRIAIYTIVVVIGTSAMSGALGGFLRYSQGDLIWVTLTQAGVGGIMQVGAIDVQSGGGRNTHVGIKGEHSDLQFIGTSRNYYYNEQDRRAGYSPFTWQPNLVSDEENVHQISVPMSPWGHRRCHATAFQRQGQQLDFELEFVPSDPKTEPAEGQPESMHMPAGVISVKVVNRLPLDLTSCWLVVGITRGISELSNQQRTNLQNRLGEYVIGGGRTQQSTLSSDRLIELYHVIELPSLASGATINEQFPARFDLHGWNQWNWGLGTWALGTDGPNIHPRISRLGTASAWIIGSLAKSPILSIDEQRSDFSLLSGTHFYIQEIAPEDLPDTLQFQDTKKKETNNSPQQPDDQP